MKIAWFCIPAHGHTNPTLGLVRALTDAGEIPDTRYRSYLRLYELSAQQKFWENKEG